MYSRIREHRRTETSAQNTIVFTLAEMAEGGAERVTSILANHFAEIGWSVHLLIEHGNAEGTPKYPLLPEVECHYLNLYNLAKRWLPKTRMIRLHLALRKAILNCHPSVIVSVMDSTNIRTLLAMLGLSIPIIVTEHCDPNVRPLGLVMSLLRRWLYPRAASVVALTETAMSFFPSSIRARGAIIPNPALQPPPDVRLDRERDDNHTIVAIGRLDKIKGYERMVAAFAQIAHQHPDWALEIWGEGAERESLLALTTQLGLTERVVFPGRTVNPYETLMHADIFAMSSWTEGFPLAMVEAMACGVPVISFDCPSGPRHIIRPDVDGILVPNGDVNALAAAMNRLMSNPDVRKQMSLCAKEVTERYSYRNIMQQWEELIARIRRRKVR